VDTIPNAKTDYDLQAELDRLKSRLAQGRRDHRRSSDNLRRLEGEIRQIEGELRSLNREHSNDSHRVR
jgi:chromosome segregation ATPase